MAQWREIGKSLAIGAVAGAVDQVLTNRDEKAKREAAASGKPISMFKQVGFYYNYILPAGLVIACAADMLKGPMADRLITVAGQLAARKATAQITSATQSAPWKAYAPAAAPVHQDLYVQRPNPQPIEMGPTVNTVQPQSLGMGMGIGVTG